MTEKIDLGDTVEILPTFLPDKTPELHGLYVLIDSISHKAGEVYYRGRIINGPEGIAVTGIRSTKEHLKKVGR